MLEAVLCVVLGVGLGVVHSVGVSVVLGVQFVAWWLLW